VPVRQWKEVQALPRGVGLEIAGRPPPGACERLASGEALRGERRAEDSLEEARDQRATCRRLGDSIWVLVFWGFVPLPGGQERPLEIEGSTERGWGRARRAWGPRARAFSATLHTLGFPIHTEVARFTQKLPGIRF